MNQETKQPINCIEGEELQQGIYYKTGCGINFIYDIIGNQEKPFLLDNGIRIDHIPTTADTGTNNLNPIQNNKNLTQEEIKQHYIDMGKKSGEARQQRKTFQETAQLFLNMKASKATLKQVNPELLQMVPEGLQLTEQDVLVLKALELAQAGSDKHQVFMRDTAGDKPTDKQQIQADIATDGDRALLDKIAARLGTD